METYVEPGRQRDEDVYYHEDQTLKPIGLAVGDGVVDNQYGHEHDDGLVNVED